MVGREWARSNGKWEIIFSTSVTRRKRAGQTVSRAKTANVCYAKVCTKCSSPGSKRTLMCFGAHFITTTRLVFVMQNPNEHPKFEVRKCVIPPWLEQMIEEGKKNNRSGGKRNDMNINDVSMFAKTCSKSQNHNNAEGKF